MLLSCLNWFNPQFRALRINLSDWLEAAADEAVTEDFAFKKRLRYSQLIAKVMELERVGSMAAGFSVNFRGERAKKSIRRSKKIMQNKEMSGVRGKAVVVSAALLSLAFGNVAAKAADTPINQMFSKNVEIVKSGEIEKIDKSDFVLENAVGYTEPADMSGFVEFNVCNTENITYEIIYKTDSETILNGEPSQVEPQHVHKIVEIILKEHEKYKDGSCKTTYYDGGECTSCGTTWKGDKINAVTQEICTH